MIDPTETDPLKIAFFAAYHSQWIRVERRWIFDPLMKPGDPEHCWQAWLMTPEGVDAARASDAAAHAALKAQNQQMEALHDAYEAGLTAALKGEPDTVNPHPPGDSYGVPSITQYWDEGYMAGCNKRLRAECDSLKAEHAALVEALNAVFQPADASPIQHYGPCGFWKVRPCDCPVSSIVAALSSSQAKEPTVWEPCEECLLGYGECRIQGCFLKSQEKE